MNRRSASLFVIMMICASAGLARGQAKPNATAAGKTLHVKLNYTGAGTVDEQHKIFVLVFDADPYQAQVLAEASSRPAKSEASATGQARKTAYILGRQGVGSKDGTATFTGLTDSAVYVVAFYDKSGTYDGHNDPGAGSSKGAYGKLDKPEPIKLEEGKAAKVVVTFDDSSTT